MELARLRLRGAYAIVAGLLLLIGIPLYQGQILLPLGYADAMQPLFARQDFGPLLLWISQHNYADSISHVLELLTFLLALGLPFVLRWALWRQATTASRVMVVAGALGFGLAVVGAVLGFVTSASAASSYVAATTAAQRATVASGYATDYAVENLLARVFGGVALAVFLGVANARALRVRLFPVLLVILGLAVAALEAGTAVLLAPVPELPEAPTSVMTVLALGLWLALTGFVLVRLKRLPALNAGTLSALEQGAAVRVEERSAEER